MAWHYCQRLLLLVPALLAAQANRGPQLQPPTAACAANDASHAAKVHAAKGGTNANGYGLPS